MQYVYAVMWFVVGYLLIARMGKENKIFYLGGALFFVFGVWWLAGAIWPDKGLFEGTLLWVFRGIIAVVLVIVAVVFFRNYGKDRKAAKEKGEEEQES